MNWIDYLRDQVTKLTARVAVLEGVSLLNYCHPVGSIYESTVSTNPGTLFGGTWVVWGAGRTSVGVDINQSEFDTVEKTGGSKYLQAHYHDHDETGQTVFVNSPGALGAASGNNWGFKHPNGTTHTASTGDGDSQNLQPYITSYKWKRTK